MLEMCSVMVFFGFILHDVVVVNSSMRVGDSHLLFIQQERPGSVVPWMRRAFLVAPC